jgi:hypothetical protein
MLFSYASFEIYCQHKSNLKYSHINQIGDSKTTAVIPSGRHGDQDPKLDFGHLGYEVLSINTLSFDPVPGFFNIG